MNTSSAELLSPVKQRSTPTETHRSMFPMWSTCWCSSSTVVPTRWGPSRIVGHSHRVDHSGAHAPRTRTIQSYHALQHISTSSRARARVYERGLRRPPLVSRVACRAGPARGGGGDGSTLSYHTACKKFVGRPCGLLYMLEHTNTKFDVKTQVRAKKKAKNSPSLA